MRLRFMAHLTTDLLVIDVMLLTPCLREQISTNMLLAVSVVTRVVLSASTA